MQSTTQCDFSYELISAIKQDLELINQFVYNSKVQLLTSLQMQQKKMQYNLSFFHNKCKQYNDLQFKATYWFGAILSLVDENEKKDLVDDVTVNDKIDIIRIMSNTVKAAASFYDQQRPNSIFKLFNFMSNLFDILSQCHDYQYIVVKVNYLNIVALYAIKTHQYSHALDIFSQILDIYNQKIIDYACQCFLVAFSNYLSFLKKSNKKLTSRMMQVESILKQSFFKYFSKLMLNQSGISSELYVNTVILLTGIYKKNESLLSTIEKDLNSVIIHTYNTHVKLKKKLPQDMIGYVIKQKIKKASAFKITLNEDQLRFYSSNKGRFNQSLILKRNVDEDAEKNRLSKIQVMLSQSIQMLNQQRFSFARYATIQKPTEPQISQFQTISPTKPSQVQKPLEPLSEKKVLKQSQLKPIIQPLPRPFTRKRQITIKSNSTRNHITSRLIKIKFKIFSTFIEVNEDGILLSDYTNQNKRYIDWNTVSLIIQKIELQFPIQEFLRIPMQNYYDFVRIISFYLRKNDNRQICLLSKPMPLLEVNELIKLYKQEGKYLKLALMNQYDTDKFVGIIDLYISEYSQFFKTLSQNEYLNYLNQRICSKNVQNNYSSDNIYHIDYLKRKRETTVTQLSNQLHADSLQIAIEDRGCLYKCVFLLKNNLQLIVRLIDNIKPNILIQNFVLQIKISNLAYYGSSSLFIESDAQLLKNTDKITKTIQVPLYKITNIFPLSNYSLKEYFQFYGKIIVDCLNDFEHFSKQQNLGGLGFDIVTHVVRTQMIQYGKYFSVVSAQLVGSKQRVWALVLRFYDLAFMKDTVTVMMNPYNDFIKQVVKASRQQQQKILKNLLINESVKQTVNWLKKAGKLDQRMNIFQYLNANKLI